MKSYRKTFGPVCGVIGAQWGDEGKGKIVDILAEEYDIVARANGGANAGHTIVVDGVKHVFRILPSGSLHESAHIVLGSGMVMHLPTLLEEIALLRKHGIDVVERLHISREAHILFDFHKEIDAAMEERRSKASGEGIGTTKRGIGPAYMDKAARTGLRMESLGSDVKAALQQRSSWVKDAFGVSIDVENEVRQLVEAQNILESCVTDTVGYLHGALDQRKSVIIEGAQATLLDIDHGTYPYVTSSSTTLAGALQGLGIAPKCVTSCIGVAKAYCTRVGSGPFPAEADVKTAERLRERGGEYGSVTKRPRRTGWLSIDDLNFSARLNGITHWNITKLDVLDTEKVIPVWVNGERAEMSGWDTSTHGITDWKALPEQARAYVESIAKQTGIPVSFVGTGQGRDEMVVCS
ncbi:adenylosuccinate synthase [Candidatus Peregrinibacteria bacterium]|nr:adenylosuccinate synthase [Candidatus Peregrinibacteria bacterium]